MASQEERDRIMAEYLAQAANGDDDDDDEEEAEFEPDEEDEDEEDDGEFDGADDEDDDDDYVVLQGTISRHDGRLVYKGHVLKDTFELMSKQHPLHWSVSHPTKTDSEQTIPPKSRTIEMHGRIGTQQSCTIDLTLTARENSASNGDLHGLADKKRDIAGHDDKDDDDAEDGKLPSKPPSAESSTIVYTVVGKSKDDDAAASTSGQAFEFIGLLDPSTADRHIMRLDCRKRTLPNATGVAAAAAAPGIVEDDDDEDDADEGVDYDELLALHQDAGLSVEDLRKRYRSSGDGVGADADDDAQKQSAKRQKKEESDDDEYGF